MSNQFYNYIADLVLTYLKDTMVKAGDRFYLQIDKHEDLKSLVQALRHQGGVSQFVYKHEQGSFYETFSIEVQDVKLVIAYTSEDVKPDFLVTLRNQVGEQQGVWHNTALLSIVSEQLDSIQGGSSDLQKQGMPLHPAYLFPKLKSEIETNVKNKVDQRILLDNMESIMQEQVYQQISFFEFEEIFATLSKGCIEDQDYKKFALFKDKDLETLSVNNLKERLYLNRELYDYVKKVHDFGLDEEVLEKMFSPEGAHKLRKEDWMDLSFSDVRKFYADGAELQKETTVELKTFHVKDRIQYWDRPHKDTKVGKRKKHLIIFNTANKEEIQLQLSFLLKGNGIKSLADKFIKVPTVKNGKVNTHIGKTNLTINLCPDSNKAMFTRVTYKHNNKASLGMELLICVLPIDPYILETYKTKYWVNPTLGVIELQHEGEELLFGNTVNSKKEDVYTNKTTVICDKDNGVIVLPQPEAFNDDEELYINLQISQTDIAVPIFLKNDLPESIPISGARIWKLKREKQSDFEWKNNRLIHGNQEFYLNVAYKTFFEWEQTWVSEGYRCCKLDADVLEEFDIELSIDLREAYSRFITYFSKESNIPSLCHYNEALQERARDYLNAFVMEIKRFNTDEEAGKRGRDLFKLGTIIADNTVFFTPFHPLMVAFQLGISQELSNEEIDNSILTRLKAEALIPYIYNSNEQLYKPNPHNDALEWMIFKPVNEVSVSDANQYLAKVVEDKLVQFEHHFSYLFNKESYAPVRINVINIENDIEVLRGLLNWMHRKIETNGIEYLKAVEVTLFRETDTESAFELFSKLDTVEEIQRMFNLRFNSKKYDIQDVIQTIREKLFYFKKRTDADYCYAHISFYKMYAQERYALQSMKDMISGLALNGLYSSVPAMKSKENYRSGFGTKAYNVENNLLVEVAYYLNELSANLRNGGNDTYRKGEAIFSRTTMTDEVILEKIFQSSNWVTFINPSVDLEFFNEYHKNLVVIHYSDQYSSSSRYDAITVTDKSQQYYSVVQEFLNTKAVQVTASTVEDTVKAFNTFNGEWLLRIIGSKGHYSREKLSIISAIKFALAYFEHPNITWVPISLEEILRVAGAVSLNKTDGIFTAKNLGVRGIHSDDLLLVGLEDVNGKLKMHFYPVEVKIGMNKNSVLDKAKIQVKQTKRLIMDALKNEEKPFTSQFYRNFFVQLFISSAKKLSQNKFWLDKNYCLSDQKIEKLLKNEFEICSMFDSIIGEGAILSFQTGAYHRDSMVDDGVTFLNLTEEDGYQGLIKPMNEMCEWIQKGSNDFVKEQMLSSKYDRTIIFES